MRAAATLPFRRFHPHPIFAWVDAHRLLIYARLMGRRDTIRATRAARHSLVRHALTAARQVKKALPRRRGTAAGGGHLILDVSEHVRPARQMAAE